MRSAPRILLGGVLLLGLAIGMVWGRNPAGVDWARVRAVCIESDDWGLCGFLPDSTALVGLDRAELAPGEFPEVYWGSTLEDSLMLARLCEVLTRHRGRDGLPAVLQANYILASEAYDPALPAGAARWTVREFPAGPPGYQRPGLLAAVHAGIRDGVWHPEYHGRWHYDPAMRHARTASSEAASFAASHQILVFPNSERAWELGPWRERKQLERELDRSLVQFKELFGYFPRSVIAPDYVWGEADEAMWMRRGLRVIQGQRQQRRASWRGFEGRVRKVLHRTWTRWLRHDRVYLDRNCIFEPVQQGAPRTITRAAIAAVRSAWRRDEAAVLEAHRINFSHLDPRLHARGRDELGHLLDELAAGDPIYLVDGELAGLQRRGTCWGLRGDRVIVRNYTRSRRLVVVPASAFASAAALSGASEVAQSAVVVAIDPGETRSLAADGRMGP
jgi:hypothetical protein